MKKILSLLSVLVTVLLTFSCQKELPDAIKNVDVSQGGQMPTPTPDYPNNQDNQTSPNDDTQPKGNLEGTWRGNMYISSYYNDHVYKATYTEITFQKDPFVYSSGNGYWVDYYNDAPWDYIANHIEWTVDSGFIKILFLEERMFMNIYDFRQKDNCFYGTISDNSNNIGFELVKTSSPNWSTYNYWGYDGWL